VDADERYVFAVGNDNCIRGWSLADGPSSASVKPACAINTFTNALWSRDATYREFPRFQKISIFIPL
jgi:hypothetical protein